MLTAVGDRYSQEEVFEKFLTQNILSILTKCLLK